MVCSVLRSLQLSRTKYRRGKRKGLERSEFYPHFSILEKVFHFPKCEVDMFSSFVELSILYNSVEQFFQKYIPKTHPQNSIKKSERNKLSQGNIYILKQFFSLGISPPQLILVSNTVHAVITSS